MHIHAQSEVQPSEVSQSAASQNAGPSNVFFERIEDAECRESSFRGKVQNALIHFDAWSKEQKRAEDCERKSQENREENESHARGDVTRLQRQVLTVEKQRLKKARLSANAQAITELAVAEPTPGCVEVCGGSLTRHQATHSSKKTMRG